MTGASGGRPDPAQGIFETMRAVSGHVQLLDAHTGRLAASWRAVYATEPPAVSADALVAAAASHGLARVRIDVIPAAKPTVTITARPVAAGPPAPVTLAPVTVPGGLGPHKWRDRALLDALGADPVALLLEDDGSVLEAAWGNVWVLDGDRLRTPPADGRILPGVTRAALLAQAAGLGLRAEEAPLTVADLEAAEATFVTSAVRLAVSAGLHAAPPEHARVVAIRAALEVA